MEQDLLKFLKILNKNQVEYIMVGSFALHLNGVGYVTNIFELWLNEKLINRTNLRKSLAETGYHDNEVLETHQFDNSCTHFYINDFILEIMTSVKGLEQFSFDECLFRAKLADLDGVIVPFLHINDLLANKKAVGRPKDQLDVIELEKIKKYLDEQSGK